MEHFRKLWPLIQLKKRLVMKNANFSECNAVHLLLRCNEKAYSVDSTLWKLSWSYVSTLQLYCSRSRSWRCKVGSCVLLIKMTQTVRTKRGWQMVVFVCFFEWTPSWKKDSGYPVIREFASRLRIALMLVQIARLNILTS